MFGFAHVSAPLPAQISPDQPRPAQPPDLPLAAAALGQPSRQNQGLIFYKTRFIFYKTRMIFYKTSLIFYKTSSIFYKTRMVSYKTGLIFYKTRLIFYV
jgi:hypothetical protein